MRLLFVECPSVLQGITGAFRPGVLTALMGASGAGKTTLMDVLADRKTGAMPVLIPRCCTHLFLCLTCHTVCCLLDLNIN